MTRVHNYHLPPAAAAPTHPLRRAQPPRTVCTQRPPPPAGCRRVGASPPHAFASRPKGSAPNKQKTHQWGLHPRVASGRQQRHAPGACSGSHQCSDGGHGRARRKATPMQRNTWWGGTGEARGQVGGGGQPSTTKGIKAATDGRKDRVEAGGGRGARRSKKCDRPRQAVGRAATAQMGAHRGAGRGRGARETGTVAQGPATQSTLPPPPPLLLLPLAFPSWPAALSPPNPPPPTPLALPSAWKNKQATCVDP